MNAALREVLAQASAVRRFQGIGRLAAYAITQVNDQLFGSRRRNRFEDGFTARLGQPNA